MQADRRAAHAARSAENIRRVQVGAESAIRGFGLPGRFLVATC